jgi:hypothetical protein
MTRVPLRPWALSLGQANFGDRICCWDGTKFRRRRTGGREQFYCSTTCKREHEAALREWARQQEQSGAVTTAELRNLRLSVPPIKRGEPKKGGNASSCLRSGQSGLPNLTLYGPVPPAAISDPENQEPE